MKIVHESDTKNHVALILVQRDNNKRFNGVQTMRYIAIFSSLMVMACEPVIDSRGFNPTVIDMKDIQIGTDNMSTVRHKFGSPSSESLFSTKSGKKVTSWFYISRKTSTTSFHRPELISQKTIEIVFDGKMNVIGIRTIHADESNHILIDEKTTPSQGNQRSIFQDILSNFGKYGNQASK